MYRDSYRVGIGINRMNVAKKFHNEVLVEFTIDGVPQPIDERAKEAVLTTPTELRGVGTELAKLIKKFHIKSAAGCQCVQHELQMNALGVQWCVDNIDIITGWLKEEAKRAKLPFMENAAKILIRRAIANANRKLTAS